MGLSTGQEFGEFTDDRDGQKYKTVKIGNQVWMAQNLNYKPESGNFWCYDNDESMREKYGMLYDWETAKAACPKGWHLPSKDEWTELVAAAGSEETGGKKLKSTSGWNENGNGTDEFGFSALPGGVRDSYDGRFYNAGSYGYWWTATEYGTKYGIDNAYFRNMNYDDDYVDNEYYDKSVAFSVRCISD